MQMNAQRYRQTDDMTMPIADHSVQQYDRLKGANTSFQEFSAFTYIFTFIRPIKSTAKNAQNGVYTATNSFNYFAEP